MKEPLNIVFGELSAELDGLVTVKNSRGESEYGCTELRPWEHEGDEVVKTENHITVKGQNAFSVKVYEYLRETKAVSELAHYYDRGGVKKFVTKNDAYAVIANNETGARQTFLISHRLFGKGATIWEALQVPNSWARTSKPASKPDQVQTDIKPVEPDPANGHKPSDDLDQATKEAIAGPQPKGSARTRANRKARETQAGTN